MIFCLVLAALNQGWLGWAGLGWAGLGWASLGWALRAVPAAVSATAL